MRLGYNQFKDDNSGALIGHYKRANVGGAIFFKDMKDTARQIKSDLPHCAVIIRDWPDNDVHRRMSPEQWLNNAKPLGEGNLIVQVINEPGWSTDLLNWFERLLVYKKQINDHTKIGLGGLSAGTPGLDQWGMADRLFHMMSDMRDEVSWLYHQYFAIVPTSGFIGGSPDHAGVPIGQPGGLNLIPLKNWSLDVSKYTKFHMGREWKLFEYLGARNLEFDVHLTETGCDYLSDIGTWIRTLHSDSGVNDTIDGWREAKTVWKGFFPEYTQENIYMTMLSYLDRYVVHKKVKSIDIFARGYNPDWTKYRTDSELDGNMELYGKGLNLFKLPQENDDTQPIEPPIIIPLPDKKPITLSGVVSLLTKHWSELES